ncbi:hypothetical protein DL89DRAFT_9671 [Linderina pennispora]|uniref:Uncharacterized protein n=1 Tax=Linderina pennispora TaxID=61395 RepID=A0A1Y1WLX4_9FUNG|nr:uncharacterized protein DL89DRAFT_9671 [Linderina pennispora]ORX74094.1 hypothetical protein DL89DRAFT_9671 [Linderina pennispora]
MTGIRGFGDSGIRGFGDSGIGGSSTVSQPQHGARRVHCRAEHYLLHGYLHALVYKSIRINGDIPCDCSSEHCSSVARARDVSCRCKLYHLSLSLPASAIVSGYISAKDDIARLFCLAKCNGIASDMSSWTCMDYILFPACYKIMCRARKPFFLKAG